MFIKTRTKHASKGETELAVFKAFGEVLTFGLGVAERVLVHLLTALLVNGFSFVHSVVLCRGGAQRRGDAGWRRRRY